jgi:hypothetical protein
LILFTLVYVAKEVTKALHQRLTYFREYESWLNIAIILSFALISFHQNPFLYRSSEVTLERWQYHINGFGVFFTWLLQMFLIGRVPRFGLYVEVFKKVSWTFLGFFGAFFFLFVAFAMAFIVLFPDHRSFVHPSPAALVKVLVMMLGELEYDDLYYPQRVVANSNGSAWTTIDEEIEPQYFPFTSQILVAIFILMVSFIIMNLLFGLAVADIQVVSV